MIPLPSDLAHFTLRYFNAYCDQGNMLSLYTTFYNEDKGTIKSHTNQNTRSGIQCLILEINTMYSINMPIIHYVHEQFEYTKEVIRSRNSMFR